jgi:hypothetical protein
MAGAAKVPITPGVVNGTPVYPDGSPVYLGGYGSWPEPATYVHDELYASALALSYKGETIVFVSLDIVGLFWQYVELIRDDVESLGLQRDHVIIGTTHSHASPDTLGIWSYYPPGVNYPYMNYIRQRTVQAITEALVNMQPAKIKYGETEVPGVVRNTRDQAERFAVTYPELTVMKVDTLDGRTIATLVNFAAHPEILGSENREVSRDFVHYLATYLEEELGGVAIYFNGAQGGMITPDVDGVFDGKSTPGYPEQHTYEMCEEVGTRIAIATINALDGVEYSSVDPVIEVNREVLTLPLENPLFYGAMLMGLLNRSYYDSTTGYLGSIRSEVEVITIGEAQIITIPGEALPSIGHRLKQMMTGRYNFILGLTNDEVGYIIPEEEWDWNGTWMDGDWTGKYEESMSLGPAVAVIVENTLMKMLSTVSGHGTSFLLRGNMWHQWNASLYVAGMVSFKLDGYKYDPYMPWWYVYPRPESWMVSWIQWNITQAYIGFRGRWGYFTGYSDEIGNSIVIFISGRIWMFGDLAHFSGATLDS